MRKKLIIFAVIFLLLAFFVSRYYAYDIVPALSVENKKISYREYLKVVDAIETSSGFQDNKKISDAELKKRALEHMIENEFVALAIARVDMSLENQAEALVQKALESRSNASLEEASSRFYNLNGDDFKKFVLLPQARLDILSERYKDNSLELTDFLNSIRKNAKVKVYLSGYRWDAGAAKIIYDGK